MDTIALNFNHVTQIPHTLSRLHTAWVPVILKAFISRFNYIPKYYISLSSFDFNGHSSALGRRGIFDQRSGT